MFLEVKMMVWKRYRRHDRTQYLDTSEYRRRDLWREPSHEFESAMRWFRISSMISFGILGHCGVLETTRTVAASVAAGIGRRPSFDGFEPIPSRDGGIIDRLPWALFISGRSCSRTGCHEPSCADSSEYFAVRAPPKDYLPGNRTCLINA